MNNKNVGLLIIVVAIIMLFVVISYNSALEDIVNATCIHGAACPMHITIKTQKIISYSFIIALLAAGAYIMFFLRERIKRFPEKEREKEIKETKEKSEKKQETKEEKKEKKKPKLPEDEKKIVDLLELNEGSLYQSDIIRELGLSKVKVTRLLDRLEGKRLIERRRRGMANIVLLK